METKPKQTTPTQRRDNAEQTNKTARATIESETATRDANTKRLRGLREAKEAEVSMTTTKRSKVKPGKSQI
ncbi:hypothetical protein FHS85_001500 [Rhodoligotrophos appendicifer]